MKYQKPELIPTPAIGAIRGQMQKQSSTSDNLPPGNGKLTPSAYEADE